jgi:hypothetical protein
MRLFAKITVVILCLIVVAIPVYVITHSTFSWPIPNLEWLKPPLHIVLVLLYVALGIWAFIALRTARTRLRRRVLESILAVIAIIWTIDVFGWAKPDFAEVLRPFTTALSYLLALLVTWIFVIDSPAKQASDPPDSAAECKGQHFLLIGASLTSAAGR